MARNSPNLGRWKIAGYHPAEYAAQWGAGNSGDGALFYNAADSHPHTGEVCAASQPPEYWRELARVATETAAKVAEVVRSGGGPARDWTMRDAENLRKLSDWAHYMAGRAESTNPWLSWTM